MLNKPSLLFVCLIFVVSASLQNSATPNFPDEFDWREVNKKCTHYIRNQGICGSCWAFATLETFADRLCIQSNSTIKKKFSPEQMLACIGKKKAPNPCDTGGYPFTVYDYGKSEGLITEFCFPYYSYFNFKFLLPKCPTGKRCHPWLMFKQKRYYVDSYEYLSLDIDSIKQQIFQFGPVAATMKVMSDFIKYRKGIYEPASTAKEVGFHAVKIIGWGKDTSANRDYWIVANSWGHLWGEHGYFRIYTDVCEISSDIIYPNPKIEDTYQTLEDLFQDQIEEEMSDQYYELFGYVE